MTRRERDIRHCWRACRRAALHCEAALNEDPLYTLPGTEPYGELQLALMTCLSTCQLTLRALESGEDLTYMASWCGTTCRETVDCLRRLGAASPAAAACESCAVACAAIMALAMDPLDTDFSPQIAFA